MSDTKFTPGPWRCEIDDDTQEPRIYAPQRDNKLREQLICAVGYCREELETSEPTARLIAAAPELFGALQSITLSADNLLRLVDELRERGEVDHWQSIQCADLAADLNIARAALLKASSEQSQ